MPDYAAFLRGINVGGHKPVPMVKLQEILEDLRFTNVRTLLASGNVVFTAPRAGAATLEKKIEAKMKEALGLEITVHVRSMEDLHRLSDAQPFKGVPVNPNVRLYVTFLSEKRKRGLKIPYESPDGNFRILRASGREVFSVLTLSPEHRTVDLMKTLEQEFGRRVTTRNYNTILKVLRARP